MVFFAEQGPEVCAPRGPFTTRAIRWAIGLLRYEGVTIQGLARQLGSTWNTLWSQIQPLLTRAANDPARFENVQVLGWMNTSGNTAARAGAGRKSSPGWST